MEPLASSALCPAPKVSVLLPTYNRAHVLRQAIDSIRAQTLEDWELIVVDDGSTDETQALVRGYCAKDSRIHYVRQPHFGAPARGLNLGLRLARGAYLHKQDDDDAAHADKLIKCAAALDERTDCSAVSARQRLYRGTPVQGWYLHEIKASLPFFFRMASVRASGGWNEFYRLAEDRVFVRKISLGGKQTARLGDILYDYFKSDDKNAPRHRDLNSTAKFYRMLARAMRPLHHWGLPDMVQPHWGLRRALKQMYFVRRHAFLPSTCYVYWRKEMRAAFARPPLQKQKWEERLQHALSSRSSWKSLWKVQLQLWLLSHHIGLPLRWRLQNGWSLARYYFSSRRQARMSKRHRAKST